MLHMQVTNYYQYQYLLAKAICKCIISDQESSIWDTNENLVIWACASSPNNNLHWFLSEQMTPIQELVNSLVKEDSYKLWHQHFGHISNNALCQAPFRVIGLPTVVTFVDTSPCKGCVLGKMHDHSYPVSGKRAIRPLGLVHTDFVGPMPTESHTRACYVLTFIDDYLGYALVAFIHSKDATSQHFQAMVSWAETFTGHSLTSVCSDQGGNLWLGNYNCSSVPEVSLTRHLFLIHPNKMVVQRGSIELCLKKQKPYANMLVCHDLSGKMLLKLH